MSPISFVDSVDAMRSVPYIFRHFRESILDFRDNTIDLFDRSTWMYPNRSLSTRMTSLTHHFCNWFLGR